MVNAITNRGLPFTVNGSKKKLFSTVHYRFFKPFTAKTVIGKWVNSKNITAVSHHRRTRSTSPTTTIIISFKKIICMYFPFHIYRGKFTPWVYRGFYKKKKWR